jgi:hypothetical protein
MIKVTINFSNYLGKFAVQVKSQWQIFPERLAQHVPDKTVNSIDKIVTMKSSWLNLALSE